MDFIELNASEAEDLLHALKVADSSPGGLRKLRISPEGTSSVKLKVNEFGWSPSMGSKGAPY